MQNYILHKIGISTYLFIFFFQGDSFINFLKKKKGHSTLKIKKIDQSENSDIKNITNGHRRKYILSIAHRINSQFLQRIMEKSYIFSKNCRKNTIFF